MNTGLADRICPMPSIPDTMDRSRGCGMTEENRATAAVQSYDYDHASAPKVRLVVCNDSTASAQATDDDDLDYPIPYSEEKAQQWVKEDPDFSIETYRQDPYFTKKNQADLREAMRRYKDGQYIRQTLINGEWVIVNG